MIEKRTIPFKVMLTPTEANVFKKKASNYGNTSAMVRDAVAKFDDRATIGKITALDEMTNLLKKYQQDFGWLGSNFNQAVKRANQLMLRNQLSQEYFENVLLPKIQNVQVLLQNLKDEQHEIFEKLIR
ncbi:MAG: hypothetical protein ACOYJG_02180 [Prevotella sp.]|jgi:ABC-type transport system involved in Fe-S cluster assembly fused permease/ATPase subunit